LCNDFIEAFQLPVPLPNLERVRRRTAVVRLPSETTIAVP